MRNEEIRGSEGCQVKKSKRVRLRSFGHVKRRDKNYVSKRIDKFEIGSKRKRSRLKAEA